MTREFAIGYLRGRLWAIVLGAVGAFALGITTRKVIFLWFCLFLELSIAPIWAMKVDLEKGEKR